MSKLAALPPGSTIGILGGGQLARMLALAAAQLGLKSHIYAPEADKMKYYKSAEYLAKKAIKVNEASADAHYALAMALGRINENASSKQKITNAKIIRAQVDRAIALNPKLAGA